jgi:hypothetical protein
MEIPPFQIYRRASGISQSRWSQSAEHGEIEENIKDVFFQSTE